MSYLFPYPEGDGALLWCYKLNKNWVFPKCFPEFAELGDKNICHHSKRAWTYHLLCKRSGCCHSGSVTHVTDIIFKKTPILTSVIYQIPRIHWIFVQFRENSNVLTWCSFFSKIWQNHILVQGSELPLENAAHCITLNNN